jgi:hypothetical protein
MTELHPSYFLRNSRNENNKVIVLVDYNCSNKKSLATSEAFFKKVWDMFFISLPLHTVKYPRLAF